MSQLRDNTKSRAISFARQRDAKVDVEAEWRSFFSADGKELINLVVVGHVDAGKSTLTGHLLYMQVL